MGTIWTLDVDLLDDQSSQCVPPVPVVVVVVAGGGCGGGAGGGCGGGGGGGGYHGLGGGCSRLCSLLFPISSYMFLLFVFRGYSPSIFHFNFSGSNLIRGRFLGSLWQLRTEWLHPFWGASSGLAPRAARGFTMADQLAIE